MALLNNNQITDIVKAAYAQATGAVDVSNITLKDIIDAGTSDGGALVNCKSQFTKSLIAAVAANRYMDTSYAGEYKDPFFTDTRDYGAIVQMISAEAPDVQESHAWQEFTSGTSQVGTYTLYMPIVDAKYYGKTSSWELPIAISYEQYTDAFKSEENFREFVSYIMVVVDNAILQHREDMNAANRNNFIAEKVNYANTVITPGVYDVAIGTVAAAADEITVCGTTFKWVANGTTPEADEIELPSTNNAANEITALQTKLSAITTGEIAKFSWTKTSSKLTATQKSDAPYAKFEFKTAAGATMAITVSTSTPAVNPKGVHVLKLRTLYNKEMSPASPISSASEFMANKECLRYMSRKILEYKDYMRKQLKLFNTEGKKKFTPENRLVLQVLGYAEQAVNTILQSDTFHNELTKLPLYDKIPCWQGMGDGVDDDGVETVTFEELSKVAVTIADGTTNGKAITVNGIVAFLADKWAIMHTIRSERVAVKNFDPEALDLYFYQFRDQYMNVLTQNALVFVVD